MITVLSSNSYHLLQLYRLEAVSCHRIVYAFSLVMAVREEGREGWRSTKLQKKNKHRDEKVKGNKRV